MRPNESAPVFVFETGFRRRFFVSWLMVAMCGISGLRPKEKPRNYGVATVLFPAEICKRRQHEGSCLEETRARKEHKGTVDHLTKGCPEEVDKYKDEDNGGNEAVLLNTAAEILKAHACAERQEGGENL